MGSLGMEHVLFPALANLRDSTRSRHLPPGKCLYINSGDPSDFDGYLVALAANKMARITPNMQEVVVVPERRACRDRNEKDTNKHDQAFSKQVLETSGKLLRLLCPSTMVVQGPLNKRNIIPLKFIAHEPEKYKPVLDEAVQWQMKPKAVQWHTVKDLAKMIDHPDVTSVVVDMYGACGYFEELVANSKKLGPKMKMSNFPIAVMAGILAETKPQTLPVPGRDPRATMNAIYYPPRALLELARREGIPLLVCPNNVCNRLLCFDDDKDLVESMGLSGPLKRIAECWYAPHLKGKYVPFDWVAMVAHLAQGRYDDLLATERRELWVGDDDAAVMVLHDPKLPKDDVITQNLAGCSLWGVVDSVVNISKRDLCDAAKALCK